MIPCQQTGKSELAECKVRKNMLVTQKNWNGGVNTKKIDTMATLTISYDGRNKIARNVVELIRSLD